MAKTQILIDGIQRWVDVEARTHDCIHAGRAFCAVLGRLCWLIWAPCGGVSYMGCLACLNALGWPTTMLEWILLLLFAIPGILSGPFTSAAFAMTAAIMVLVGR